MCMRARSHEVIHGLRAWIFSVHPRTPGHPQHSKLSKIDARDKIITKAISGTMAGNIEVSKSVRWIKFSIIQAQDGLLAYLPLKTTRFPQKPSFLDSHLNSGHFGAFHMYFHCKSHGRSSVEIEVSLKLSVLAPS